MDRHALDPATKKWQMFQQTKPLDGFSYGQAVDAEDNGWWSVWNADVVYKADAKTGAISEIPMRDPDYAARKALATPADLEFYHHRHANMGRQFSQSGVVRKCPAPDVGRPTRKHGVGAQLGRPESCGNRHSQSEDDLSPVARPRPAVQDRGRLTAQRLGHGTDGGQPGQIRSQGEPLDGVSLRQPRVRPRAISVDDQRSEVWVPCDQSSKVARFQFRTEEQIRSQKAAAQANR